MLILVKIKSTFKPDESINSINDGIYGSKENIANTFLNELWVVFFKVLILQTNYKSGMDNAWMVIMNKFIRRFVS